MKPKLLYVGTKIDKPSGGAEVVNKRNQSLLESCFSVTYTPLGRGLTAKLFLSVTNECLREIGKLLKDKAIEYVFVQQSLLGRACRHIKERYPEVRIFAFFHNVEVQYAREYIKTKGLKALPFYLAVSHWEQQTCRYADVCITLNGRDSKLLSSIYHRASDLELPTSFPDDYDQEKCVSALAKTGDSIDYLFVGVAFFANVEAVQWFIDHVMPYVEGNLCIVGKGMDKVAFKNLSSRVRLYGFVEDLSEFYYRARLVVSPIHVGGGMKTKTAEALMYGKTILGSSEAFEGYGIDDRCMVLCNTADDYISSIRKYAKKDTRFNAAARSLFQEKYSNDVVEEQFRRFLKENFGSSDNFENTKEIEILIQNIKKEL